MSLKKKDRVESDSGNKPTVENLRRRTNPRAIERPVKARQNIFLKEQTYRCR